MIVLEPQTLAAARKLRPAAVAQVLQSQVGEVYRIAYALSGRWDVGRGIARFVLNRSVKMMPKWKPEDDPANWFHRFTVQTSRRSAHHQTAPAKDVLVEQAEHPSPQYIAFVAALRQLHVQQREAFLLRHGEKLNERYCAVAMDCSTQAAENHLKAAEESMRLVAGPQYEPLLRQMMDAYAHLTPEPDQLLPTVKGVVFRRVRLRKLVRFVWQIALLALALLMMWAAGKIWLWQRDSEAAVSVPAQPLSIVKMHDRHVHATVSRWIGFITCC